MNEENTKVRLGDGGGGGSGEDRFDFGPVRSPNNRFLIVPQTSLTGGPCQVLASFCVDSPF